MTVLDEVLCVLRASLEPRQAAEATRSLGDWEQRSEYWAALLNIAGERDAVDLATRQAALLQLKNGVERHWRKSATYAIPAPLKSEIRCRLLDLLQQDVDLMGKTLELCVARIARWDYDTEWASLPDELLAILAQSLRSGSNPVVPRRALGALVQTLKALTANRMPRGRLLIQQISRQLFPTLSSLYLRFLSSWTEGATLAAPMDLGLLIFKSLRIILIYGWIDPSSDSHAKTFLLSTVVHFSAIKTIRKSVNVARPDAAMGRLLTAYAKLWKDLLLHNPQAVANMGLKQQLIETCFGAVQEACRDVDHLIRDDLASLFPSTLMSNLLITLKLMLVDWTTETAHPAVEGIVYELGRLLVERLLVLRPASLEAWSLEAEEWANSNEVDLEDTSLRSCSKGLLKALSGRYPQISNLLTQLLTSSKSRSLDILTQEALYQGIALCATQVAGSVDLDHWLATDLEVEAGSPAPQSRILRRAIAIMLGELTVDEQAASVRSRSFALMVRLLADDGHNDLAVRLAAAQALSKGVGNSWHFQETDILPCLNNAINGLLVLLSQCTLPDSQLRVNSSLATLIERLSRHIVPYTELLIGALPPVWDHAGDHHLVRVSVITTMTRVIEAIGPASENLHAAVASIVAVSCDMSRPEHLFLMEDAIDLWLATIQQTRVMSPSLTAMESILMAMLAAATDGMPKILRILESYCLLDGSNVLSRHGDLVFSSLGQLLGGAKLDTTTALLQTLSLAVTLCPSSIWAPTMDTSQCFAKLLHGLEGQEDSALVLAKYLAALARLVILDRDVFLALVHSTATRTGSSSTQMMALLLDQWLDKLDNYQVGQRKLVALALSLVAGKGLPEALRRLPEICAFWLVPLAETAESAGGDSGLYHRYSTDEGGLETDSSAIAFVAGEDSPDRRRRVEVLQYDPIHSMQLATTIGQELAHLPPGCLTKVDALVLDELARRIKGELAG